MFKRKAKSTEAEQPQDFPIVDGKPKARVAKPEPKPEPVVEVAPEPTILPEPAKRPTPESHPHLFDFAGNPL